MQEQLRRFTHRADEQQQSDRLSRIYIHIKERERDLCKVMPLREYLREVNTVGHHIDGKDTKREAEIANTINDKRFHRRRISRRLAVVETYQKIRSDAHALPTEKHLQQVVGCYQH